MRWRSFITVHLGVLLAACSPSQAQTFEAGEVEKCDATVPAALAVPAPSPELDVHVHVVLDDGVTLAEGRQAVETANIAYEPIGLRLVASFTTATMHSDNTEDLFGE